MADWFKFYNDGLDAGGLQYCISEQPLVAGVWLVILSEASKNRSSRFPWDDTDFRLLGFARKINISPAIFNQCINLLEHAKYIIKKDGMIEIPGWEKMQSDYARGLEKGYYKNTPKKLASNSLVSTPRGEEKRVEKKRKERPVAPLAPVLNGHETEHQKFMRLWKVAYELKFKRAYRFNGGRDGKVVKEMLNEPGATAEDLMEPVRRAWSGEGGYWCRELITIPILGHRWNEITHELNDPENDKKHAINGNVLAIRNQVALTRIEDRIKYLRGQFPLTDPKKKVEFDELKSERTKLMQALQFKA